MTERRRVFVEAPSRLHMGLVDLRGDRGRRFGGLGAALETPSLLLEAWRSDRLSADGADCNRAFEAARAFLDGEGIRSGAYLHVHRAVPAHSGLGSGTQIALATARALAALYDRPGSTADFAAVTGRARRSAIGTWVFDRGGFVLEGGRVDGDERPAPLLVSRPMPPEWRCILVIPDVPAGLSGSAEEQAFRSLPPPDPDLAGHVAHVILMTVLPALVEENLRSFGAGITDVQRAVGEMFRPAQGGLYAHPRVARLVEALLAAGAAGAGQSSWGPAVFGFADGNDDATLVMRRLAPALTSRDRVIVSRFDNCGARCWEATADDGAA